MAEGDSWTEQLGSATELRQPSAGVEEQVIHMVKNGATDQMQVYDGSVTRSIIAANRVTSADIQDALQTPVEPYNLKIIITNGVYLRKSGTTDRSMFGGVQVG